MIQLRDYQLNIESGVRDGFRRGCRSQLVVSPTGSGKTITFSHLANLAMLNGKIVWILVHRKELLRQTVAALKLFGIFPGIIAAGYPADYITKTVFVCSVDTLAQRYLSIPIRPDLIIVDEAHHSTTENRHGAIPLHYMMEHGAFVAGFTATPERLDGTGLGRNQGGIFDEMILGPTPAELIERGSLSKYKYYAYKQVSSDGLHRQGGDFKANEDAELMSNKQVVGNMLDAYDEIGNGDPGIIFCASVKHAQTVKHWYDKSRYKFEIVEGRMRGKERTRDGDIIDRTMRALEDGTINGIISVNLINEGVDVPRVSVIQQARHTESLAMHLQQQGRGLRPDPDDPDKVCKIIDHVGNGVYAADDGGVAYKHGFPDDSRIWTLDAIKRSSRGKGDADEEPEVELQQCKGCFQVYKRSLTHCPFCGVESEAKPAQEIKHVDGEIIEIDPGEIRAKKKDRRRQCKTLEDFQAMAKEFGYKPGWAYYAFRAREEKLQQRRSTA